MASPFYAQEALRSAAVYGDVRRLKRTVMNPVMNDTKWDELRIAMHELRGISPRWRTRDIESGYESSWDRDWFYHFRVGCYRTIEWVEIAADDSEQLAEIEAVLVRIHLPGERTDVGFKVYGYVPEGKAIDYVRLA